MHERTVRARTATGIVEGFTRDGVHRWRSIPYARAPVGSLRFRAPQPAQPWPGVRHCHTGAGSTVAVSLASDHRRGIMFADVPWRGNRINRIRYFPA